MRIYFYFLTVIWLHSCMKMDCDQVPSTFRSYEEAISFIKAGSFKIKEEINNSNSTWITGASFYSCNGTNGYFILGTENKEYLHSGVSYSLWKEFKNSESLGSFYNKKIKGRYRFSIR